MKSAGRHHKPVKNELAQWLGEHIEEWKPHFPVIGGIAVLVLVGGDHLSVRVFRRRQFQRPRLELLLFRFRRAEAG